MTSAEVANQALEVLGLLDAGVDLASPEALAAALRRAASVHCPISRRRLMRLVAEPLRSLVEVKVEFDELLSETLEQLLAIGDLVERRTDSDGAQLVFLGMPRFVELDNRSALVLGSRPDGTPILDEDLMPFLVPESGARFFQLPSDSVEAVGDVLSGQGLLPIGREQWASPPRAVRADVYLEQLALRAKAGLRAGELDTALGFNPSTRVDYYRGRWGGIQVGAQGLVLVRRPQAYGADRWSICWAAGGIVETLVDLPIDPGARACDEAWRIMAAIDRTRDQPLPVRAHVPVRDRVVIDLFAPPPAWLQRQFATLGYPVRKSRGALLSYSVRAESTGHLRDLVTATMWVDWINTEGEMNGS